MMTNRHSEDFWRAGLWALVCVLGLVGAQLLQHRAKYGADPDRPPPYLLWEQPRAFCERLRKVGEGRNPKAKSKQRKEISASWFKLKKKQSKIGMGF